MKSEIENMLSWMLQASNIDGWVREYKFNPDKPWRFNFCWEKEKFAVEIYKGGNHVRSGGITRECEKYNDAVLLGWRILLVTKSQVKSEQVLEWIREAISEGKV